MSSFTVTSQGMSDAAAANSLQQRIAAAKAAGTTAPGYANVPNGPGASLPASAGTGAQQDANAIVQQFLSDYGLQSLSGWAWNLITQGASAAQVDQQLRQRPEFAQRFPGIIARQRAGLPPISPGEYVAYENQAQQMFHQAGLPDSFYTSQQELGNLIGSDVSISELGERIQQGYQAAAQAPQEVRDQLQRLYGIDQGHLAAFFLDPTTAEPLIMKRFRAAQIAGQSQLTGYDNALGQTQAEQLAAQGVTDAQAQQGFSQLGHESQLFGALPGSPRNRGGGRTVLPGRERRAKTLHNSGVYVQP